MSNAYASKYVWTKTKNLQYGRKFKIFILSTYVIILKTARCEMVRVTVFMICLSHLWNMKDFTFTHSILLGESVSMTKKWKKIISILKAKIDKISVFYGSTRVFRI